MTLLLVEPSILLRDRLASMLASTGYVEIVEASTVEEAGLAMRVIQPEIVIMDGQLPDEAGLGALSRMNAKYPSACLIVISPDATEPYKKRWLRAGADHCFDLSMQLEQLLEVVMCHSRTLLC